MTDFKASLSAMPGKCLLYVYTCTNALSWYLVLVSYFHLSAALLRQFSTDCCMAEYRLLLGFTQTFMLETANLAAQLNCEALQLKVCST